jgi:hypothetical protein
MLYVYYYIRRNNIGRLTFFGNSSGDASRQRMGKMVLQGKAYEPVL